jgi:hypothetical protein
MSLQELDELLVHYFKLFLPSPEKGSIGKIAKFMRFEEEEMSVKAFAASFREYFPHVQKYLKDFYLLKFK